MSVTGCTYYNGEKTGRYLQVIKDEDSTKPSYGIDVFRFGYFVQVVLRRYDLVLPNKRDERFNKDTFCAWSFSTRLEGEKFSVQIPNRGRTSILTGTFEEGGKLSVFIQGFPPTGEDVELDFTISDAEPDSECKHDRYLPLATQFPKQDLSQPEVKEIIDQLEKPVFSILWVGVSRVNTGGISVFTGTRQIADESVSVKDFFVNRAGTLSLDPRTLRMDWPAPTQTTTYSPSGSTFYAIGHPVVINDANDGSEKFSWLPRQEPIIGSPLRLEKDINVPYRHTGHGRAILYVDGSILDLEQTTKDRMSYLKSADKRELVSTIPNPNAHLYICEIYFDGNNITHIDILSNPAAMTVPLYISSIWSEGTSNQLPRFFP